MPPKTISRVVKTDEEEARKLCREWYKNKLRNPLTNKPISAEAKNGPYKEFEKICNELGVKSRSKSSSSKSKISATPSVPSDTEIAMRLSMMNIEDNIDSKEQWAIKKCGNENPITLMPFDADDADNLFVIRIARADGKYGKKGSCFRRDDLLTMLEGDLAANDDMFNMYIPSNILANWVTSDVNRMAPNGIGGRAGHKLYVKIPPNNIFVTLKSYYRIFKEKNVNEWFAVPMFNKEPKRIGNLFSYIAVSTTHGQAPGSILYKLYTREELQKLGRVLGNEDNDEYDPGSLKMRNLWDTPLEKYQVKLMIKNIVNKTKKMLNN